GRGKAAGFAKSDRERFGIGIADLLRNVSDAERRVQQEMSGALHAASEQILLKACPDFFFEEHADVIQRIMKALGKIDQGNVLMQMVMNPGAHLLNKQAF